MCNLDYSGLRSSLSSLVFSVNAIHPKKLFILSGSIGWLFQSRQLQPLGALGILGRRMETSHLDIHFFNRWCFAASGDLAGSERLKKSEAPSRVFASWMLWVYQVPKTPVW